ncbi:MAG: hypothetical protein ACYTFP_07525 [Planctomycetota bacterium]|jgi:endonuclease/exonuclease/phosphatase family metal-dependent hydrolase
MKQLQGIGVLVLAALLILITGCGSGYSVSRRVAFSPGQSDQAKVMTFNIRTRTILDGLNHWNHRKEFVKDTIAGNGADIVGLQEVRNSQLNYIKSGLPILNRGCLNTLPMQSAEATAIAAVKAVRYCIARTVSH